MAGIAEEHRWPCLQCGADLVFAPGQERLKCDYCGHEQAIAAPEASQKARALGEVALARGLAFDTDPTLSEEVRATSCPSCGAVVEFAGASHAETCPWCATPVVVDTGVHRRLKPQAVIPMVLTEREAREALTKWLGSLWFAPNRLLDYTRKGRAMRGLYVPWWSFDADTASRYTGQRGEHYYETRTVSVTVKGKRETRQERVQKTRWYPAAGRVARVFDDVLIPASRALPAHLAARLSRWDLGALQPYAPDYLSGFEAEGHSVTLRDGHEAARARMAAVIAQDVRQDIGGDEQRITSVETDWRDETFRHLLFPVWTAAYLYGGKSYRFVVNGQSGEVRGERPWSIWKIALAVLVAAALVLGGVWLADPEALGLPPRQP